MAKRREQNITINAYFVPTPGWEKDYQDGLQIFLRMLERAAAAKEDDDSKISSNND